MSEEMTGLSGDHLKGGRDRFEGDHRGGGGGGRCEGTSYKGGGGGGWSEGNHLEARQV